MSSNLSQLQARVAQLLLDPTNAIFTTGLVQECLRSALSEYNEVNPLAKETVITLPAAGREIALNGIAGLVQVTEAWLPYDSLVEQWPPNRVRGFRLWWDDAQPVLFLDLLRGAQPQANDNLRLWYTALQTIQDLDGADATTVADESLLVRGAAGLCCLARSVDLNETPQNMAVSTPNYGALADFYLNQERFGFYPRLDALRAQAQVRGPAFGAGWQLDKWDEQ